MAWPTYPTAQNCRNGTTPASLPLAVGPRNLDHFTTRMAELTRKSVGSVPGMIPVLGCSMGNYVPWSRLSPYAVDYTITGNDLRKVMHQIADDHEMSWFHDGTVRGPYPVKGVNYWTQAAGIVIYGLLQNHLNQEALEGYSSADTLVSATGMLQKIAAWLTGPLVIYECTPVLANNGNPGITSANIEAINSVMQTIFLNRANTVLIQNAYKFKDSNGHLNPAYSLDGLHLNAAGIAIQIADGRAALTTLGIGG